MSGKPCIRGLRVTVANILRQLANHRTPAEILASYPYLEAEDIDACLAYAAGVTRGHSSLRRRRILLLRMDNEFDPAARRYICAALTQAEEALTQGALLTISPKRARLRRLPIIPGE